MTPPVPTFEIIGDGRLSDEAIEALAALLLSVAEADSKTPRDEHQDENSLSPAERCA